MNNCYVLKDYNIEKKIVVCKICTKHKKVKNKDLKTYICCNNDKWNFEKTYNVYKKRAIKKNIGFELSRYEFERLVTSNCFYCKSEPELLKDKLIRNGIDRVRNDFGYDRTNTISCCSTCNFMKRTMSFDNFKTKIDKISSNLKNISENKDNDIGLSLLFNSGYSNIDLQMCLYLHSLELIKLTPEIMKSYISSITDVNEIINYISVFGSMVNRGANCKGMNIIALRELLFFLTKFCLELVNDKHLRLRRPNDLDKYEIANKTKMKRIEMIPMGRRDIK